MNASMDRRRFLKQTVAAAASGSFLSESPAGALEKKEAAIIPIVDTHQHLWDLSKFKLPWIKEGRPLAKSFLIDDYLKATAGLNVVKAVYTEVDVDPRQQQAEAEYIIDICKRKEGPTVAAVISGRPASEGFKAYITQFKDSPYIKGVRQVLHREDMPADYCLDEKFVKGIRLLGELG